MSREWQAGDVAVRTSRFGLEQRSIVVGGCMNDCHADGLHWHHQGGGWDPLRGASSTYRPLVVIDPEDREQVERLTWALQQESTNEREIDDMQAALREFANPTPPKPPEPTGRYAVVVDANGNEWLRTAEDPPAPWLQSGSFVAEGWTDYADITAVRILSGGVSDV